MKKVLLVGLGHIGRAIAGMSPRHHFFLHDTNILRKSMVYQELCHKSRFRRNGKALSLVPPGISLQDFVKSEKVDAIISAVPHHATREIVQVALDQDIHYLDMTEDVCATQELGKTLSSPYYSHLKSWFVPNNGVAPGFVAVATKKLITNMMEQIPRIASLDEITLRVGALPMYVDKNRLKYKRTWSLAGCINQYTNPCRVLRQGEICMIPPLSEYGIIRIRGEEFEEFTTSGGVGSLCDTLAQFQPLVKNVTYKTLRHPGHYEKLTFLLDDLGFAKYPKELVSILERTLSITRQDQVIVHITVQASTADGQVYQDVLSKKIHPVPVDSSSGNEMHFSAIEVATASSTLAVLDLVLDKWQNKKVFPNNGHILKVEDIPYHVFQQRLRQQPMLSNQTDYVDWS